MKIISRITVILTVLFVLLASYGCGGGDDAFGSVTTTSADFTTEEPFTFDVNVVNQTLLKLDGINGEVEIIGASNSTTAKISGTKRVESNISKIDAEQQLQEIEVRVLNLANEINVGTVQPKDTGSRNYIVDYKVTLPRFLLVQVANVNGAVKLDSIESNVTVRIVNGQVTLVDIIGSSSVNIVNGAMDCRVTLPLNGTVNLNTGNGNINLFIPATTSAVFSAKVSNGTINTTSLMLQNEIRTNTSLSGILGTGQGMISLETVNGNISVSGF